MHALPYLYVLPALLKVLSTLPVNDQLATPSVLLHWYVVKVPLPPQLNSLQAVSASHRVQPSLLVKDQCGQQSMHTQSCTVNIPHRCKVHTFPYLYVFPAPLKVLSTLPVNDQLATSSVLLHWYLVKVPLPPQLNSPQAVSAPDRVQPSLLVKDQCGQHSIHTQSCTLIVPYVQHLDAPVLPALFFCTPEGAVHPASELSACKNRDPVPLVPCDDIIASTAEQPALNAGCLCTSSLAISPKSER